MSAQTREESWLKDLRKVARTGCDLDRVLMVDDESHKLEKNHGNPIERGRVRAASPFTRQAGSDVGVASKEWALAPKRMGS